MAGRQLMAIWNYRGFILGSVKREFQARYRNSIFGCLWTILGPLSTIFIYTVIFSKLMRARLPGLDDTMAYGFYLCSGVISWTFFAEILTRCQTVFLENANMMKKLNFPRICLPVIVVLNAGINFAIGFGLFLCVLLLTGKFPGWIALGLPVVLAIQTVFAIGLGMMLGIINVFFRDVGQFVGIILQFWFWFTPIVYPLSVLPEAVRTIIYINPMVPIISAYQSMLVYGRWPQWLMLFPSICAAIIFCMLGVRLFKQRAGEMVDEL